MDQLAGIREKMRQGQKAVSAARANLEAMGKEDTLDHLAVAQAHLDQAATALEEGENLRQASWHIGQLSEQLELAIERLRD